MKLATLIITFIVAVASDVLQPGFDRSAVENELRNPFYSIFNQPLQRSFEFRPYQYLARTHYGTYYGAAVNPYFLQFLPQKNLDVFPLSKVEIQSKPGGITDYQARKALKEATYKDSGMDHPHVCFLTELIKRLRE